MESYLLDWANLLLRWAHVITAIAWIGSSFYFVFLDSSLTPPVDEDLSFGRCMAAGFTTRLNLLPNRRCCPQICTGFIGKATAPGSPALRC
jgi:hypothetical protein